MLLCAIHLDAEYKEFVAMWWWWWCILGGSANMQWEKQFVNASDVKEMRKMVMGL